MNITLHPEYGVNPCLGLCFWCGKGDGTLGLLGLNKGKKAPREAVITLEPCDTCKANMALGITVIEATDYQRDPWQVPVQRGAFPTGRWCVVKRDAQFWECINEPRRSEIMTKGRMFIEPKLYEGFGFAAAGEKNVETT